MHITGYSLYIIICFIFWSKMKGEWSMRASIISKVLVFLLLFTAVVPIYGGKTYADTDVDAAIDQQIARDKYILVNFDNYSSSPSVSGPAGVIGGNWGLSNIAIDTDYLIGETIEGKVGKSLTFVSTAGMSMMMTRYNQMIPSVKPTPLPLVLEGKFKVNTTKHERRILHATLNSTSDPSVSTTLYVAMDNNANFKVVYPKPDGSTGTASKTFGTYEANTWYHVQAYVNLQNYTVDIYVNGEKQLESVNIGSTWDNINTVRVQQFSEPGVDVRLTMDDLMVYDFIPVQDVSVAVSKLNMIPGQAVSIDAQVSPIDATNSYLTWSSSNPSAAIVDNYGKVTAVAAGTATIIALSKENAAKLASVEVKVDNYDSVTAVEIQPLAATVETDRSLALVAVVTPSSATNQAMTWTSSNPDIATVDSTGVVVGIMPGVATITATSNDNGVIAQSTITVIERTTYIEEIIVSNQVSIALQDSISFTPRLIPTDATNRTIYWGTSDEAVATVDIQGRVTGHSLGTAIITAYAADRDGLVTAPIKVTVVDHKAEFDVYDQMRLKWKSILDGGDQVNLTNSYVIEKINQVNGTAEKHWRTMNKEENRTALWDDLQLSTTDSGIFNSYVTYLRDMAYAYSMKGGTLYHNETLKNDILLALDWVYKYAYNENIVEYGNWWNFDIGAPLRLVDIMVMLYDDLDEEDIARFVRTADFFIGDITAPSFTQGGANRSDIMTVELIMGILTKDETRIQDAVTQLSPLFDYVTEGDGFYEDGSYIQHGTIPYTGSYGEVLIRGLGQLFYLLDDTPFVVTDPKAIHVYDWIYNSIEPVIYQGETMDMIRGRAVAREQLSGHRATFGMLMGIMRLSMSAPTEDAAYIKSMLKQWLLTTDPKLDIYSYLTIDLIEPIEQLLSDSSVIPHVYTPKHYEFGAMNRTVHIGNQFALGISKSSNRIATYELTNGENGKGWYTGDGMTYIYNSDVTHYSDDFWATVNRYRLPGTTVDTRARTNDHYQYGDGETTPNNTWAGGVTLGSDGVSGMNLQQVGTTLTANKSWFMFGDTIVAVGSAITSKDQRTIETIVEQRKLNGNGDNGLLVNGVPLSPTLGTAETLSNVSWAHLQGNTAGADIGYYFPESTTLHASRTAQSGTWYDNNRNENISTDLRTRNYATMWFDHGANPLNETYSYVLLPNHTSQETAQFAASPTIQIVENSVDAHAVKNLLTNQIGINFWKDQLTTVNGITVNRQASILVKENADQTLEVAISDPTYSNTGMIEVELDHSAASVLVANPNILVTQLAPTIKFKVSTKDSLSRSFTITFDIDPLKERPAAEMEVAQPKNSKEATSEVTPIAHLYSTFNQEQLGNEPKIWSVRKDPNTTATIYSLNSADHFLRLIDQNASGNAEVSTTFADQAGILELEWKAIHVTENSEMHYQVSDGRGIAIELVANRDGIYWVDSLAIKHFITELDIAYWNTVKLFVNVERQIWDITLDGMLLQTNIPFKESVSSINQFALFTGNEAVNTTVYIDDIAVYVTGAISIFTDEFEDSPLNTHPAHWLVTEVDNAPIYITTDDGLNHSVIIDDNAPKRSTIERSFAAQSNRVIAEWKYKEMSGGKYPEFQIYAGNKMAVRLSSNSNNFLRYYAKNATETTIINSAVTKNNKWQHIKVDMDIVNQVYDLYFEGTLVLDNEPFYSEVNAIDRILFGSGHGAIDAPLYIDSVKLYSFDLESPRWNNEAQLLATNISANEVNLSWPAAEDNVGIGMYSIYVNGTYYKTVNGQSHSVTVTQLHPETTYTFSIEAIDKAGNIVEQLLSIEATTIEETIEQPGDGSDHGSNGNTDQSTVDETVDSTPNVSVTYSVDELLNQARNGMYSTTTKAGYGLALNMDGLSFEELTKLWNTTLNNINLHIYMGDPTAATMNTILERLKAHTFNVRSDIMEYQLTVSSGENSLRLDQLKAVYFEWKMPLAASSNLEQMSVLQYDPVSEEFLPVPARFIEVNGVKQAIFKSMNNGIFLAVEHTQTFDDITSHWAQKSIEQLASKRIVNGVTAQEFAPNQQITRAEFITMLVRALSLQTAVDSQFTDVQSDTWYNEAVDKAYQIGLVQGYADGTFRPNELLTRQEMSIVIARALSIVNQDFQISGEYADQLVKFADRAQISTWAQQYIATLVQYGVVQGTSAHTFAPLNVSTRAEAAIMVSNLLSSIPFYFEH